MGAGGISSGPRGSFWLSVPTSWLHWPCCLLVTRGQPRSRHLDSGRGGRAPAVGRPGRKTFPETPSLIPFCFSLCLPPQGGHGSLSLRPRHCHLIPVRRKRRNSCVSSPRPHLLVWWTKTRRPRARLASPILVPLLHTPFQATGFCIRLIGHYNNPHPPRYSWKGPHLSCSVTSPCPSLGWTRLGLLTRRLRSLPLPSRGRA